MSDTVIPERPDALIAIRRPGFEDLTISLAKGLADFIAEPVFGLAIGGASRPAGGVEAGRFGPSDGRNPGAHSDIRPIRPRRYDTVTYQG